MKKQPRSDCPIGVSLDVFGDRWTLLILRDLLMRGKRRYQEFCTSREGIATNLLAQRLESLVEHGIITKSDDPTNKKQFLYAPTQRALDLLPVMCEIIRWGLKHQPEARTNWVIDTMLKNEKKFKSDIAAQFPLSRSRK